MTHQCICLCKCVCVCVWMDDCMTLWWLMFFFLTVLFLHFHVPTSLRVYLIRSIQFLIQNIAEIQYIVLATDILLRCGNISVGQHHRELLYMTQWSKYPVMRHSRHDSTHTTASCVCVYVCVCVCVCKQLDPAKSEWKPVQKTRHIFEYFRWSDTHATYSITRLSKNLDFHIRMLSYYVCLGFGLFSVPNVSVPHSEQA